MRFDELNEDNHLLFAIKHYENPHGATMEDFEEDLKRFKYIKRLLKKSAPIIHQVVPSTAEIPVFEFAHRYFRPPRFLRFA